MNVSQVLEKLPPAFVISNKRNVQKYSPLLVVVLVLHKYGFCSCLSPCLTRTVWTTTPVSFSLLHKYDDSDVEPLPTSVSTSPGRCWTATCIRLSTSMITLVLNHYLHLSLCQYDDIRMTLNHYLTSVTILMLNYYLYISTSQVWWHWCWTTTCIFLSTSQDVELLPASFWLHWCWTTTCTRLSASHVWWH